MPLLLPVLLLLVLLLLLLLRWVAVTAVTAKLHMAVLRRTAARGVRRRAMAARPRPSVLLPLRGIAAAVFLLSLTASSKAAPALCPRRGGLVRTASHASTPLLRLLLVALSAAAIGRAAVPVVAARVGGVVAAG